MISTAGRNFALLVRIACCGAALLAVGAVVSAGGEEPLSEGVSAQIRAIVHAPTVKQQLTRWGIDVADVQHDVDTMTPAERQRLLAILTRPWPASATYSQADYQAQYLVTVSLLRESKLYASVISTR